MTDKVKADNKIALIIPYFKGGAFIGNLLDSIETATQDCAAVDVIFVDNDKDGITLPVQQSDINITVLRTRPGIGFGRACNIGLAHVSKGSYSHVFLLNQDVILGPFSLDTLIEAANKHPTSLITPVSKTYDMAEIPEWYANRYFAGKSLESEFVELENIAGNCLGGTTEAVEHAGYLDPIFHMYEEDRDYITRLRESGQSLILATRATIGHYNASVSKQGDERNDKKWKRDSAIKFAIRHGSVGEMTTYWVRSYGHAVKRLWPGEVLRYVLTDLSMIFSFKKIRSARNIQTRAVKQIKQDLI